MAEDYAFVVETSRTVCDLSLTLFQLRLVAETYLKLHLTNQTVMLAQFTEYFRELSQKFLGPWFSESTNYYQILTLDVDCKLVSG